MALPAAKYPAAPFDGNEQTQPVLPEGGTDVANAGDYNKATTEVKAQGDDLRAANTAGGKDNHAAVHTDQEARVAALEAAPAGGGPDIFIVKSADESVVSSEVLQDDDELFFAVAAGDIWVVSLMVHYVEDVDSLKYTIDIDAGAPAVARFNSFVAGGQVLEFGDPVNQPGGGSLPRILPLHAILDNTGGDASTVRFRWAQDFSDAAPTVVKRGSSLLAWKQ